MKTYKAYKNSGVDWIGKIPEDWQIKKMKWTTSIKRGASPRPIADLKYFDDNGEFSWVRIADVSASERYLLETKEKLSELGSSLSVKRYPGDFFLSIAGSVGKPIITKIKCCIHDGFVWFPDLTINPEFLYYIFQSDLPFGGLGKVGTQLNLNTETIGNIEIPFISENEINSILGYLDHKTTIINALIEKKQHLINKLQAQRQAIINEAVTKGLNPNAKMKDSGVEWLGEIPEHWEIGKLSYYIEIVGGSTPKTNKEEYWDGELNWVTTDDLGKLKTKEITNTRRKITSLGLNNCSASLIPINSVIMSCRAPIGHLGILKVEASTNQGCKGLVPIKDNILADYLYYLLLSGRKELESLGTGSTFMEISTSKLKDFKILLPTKEEQKDILSFIKSRLLILDKIIDMSLESIIKLKLYRQSLISEAVTGKIDVRDWQAPTKN